MPGGLRGSAGHCRACSALRPGCFALVPCASVIVVAVPTLAGPGYAQSSSYARCVETFYIGLLVAVALLVTWFALYVVYRLLHEDK